MDFLILYEHAARELENSCLLSEELKKRGYSVRIECIYSIKKYFYHPKVLIAPHLYNDNQIEDFATNIWGSIENIVDLQYEQVLSEKDIESNHHVPKDSAVQGYHIAWGDDQYNRYKNSGINDDNIRLTGSISMDLNHSSFKEVFNTKKEVSETYGIPVENEWVLFISSFSLCNRSEEEIRSYEKILSSIRILTDISIRSKKEILNWLELSIVEFPDKIFIYRPHPAEKEDDELKIMENKYSNFRVISDYSIRQWARVVDRTYTWFSTSIVDFYYSNLNCEILRPYAIPSNMDVVFLRDARTIKTFDQFNETLQPNYIDKVFPIESSDIIRYYGDYNDGLSYHRIADLCEFVLKAETSPYKNQYYFKFNFKSMKILFMGLAYELCKHFRLSGLMHKVLSKKYILQFERAEKEMYKVKSQIKIYENNFKKLINNLN